MRPRKRNGRTLIAGILLVAFALRALIPPGFMPAADRPFSFDICWEGFPADMLAHGGPPHTDSMDMGSMDMGSMDMHAMSEPTTSHRAPLAGAHRHHSGSPAHPEHCVFGTACSAGPTPHLPLLSVISSARQLRSDALVSVAGAVRLVHLPQSRAPPDRLG